MFIGKATFVSLTQSTLVMQIHTEGKTTKTMKPVANFMLSISLGEREDLRRQAEVEIRTRNILGILAIHRMQLLDGLILGDLFKTSQGICNMLRGVSSQMQTKIADFAVRMRKSTVYLVWSEKMEGVAASLPEEELREHKRAIHMTMLEALRDDPMRRLHECIYIPDLSLKDVLFTRTANGIKFRVGYLKNVQFTDDYKKVTASISTVVNAIGVDQNKKRVSRPSMPPPSSTKRVRRSTDRLVY